MGIAWLLISALPLLCLVGEQAEGQELVWRDGATLAIEGKGWSDTESPYDRFPSRAKAVVPASVWDLSRHSAGIALHFRTDAPKVAVRWTLTSDGLAMPHMPATGVSGVDLYRRDGGQWRFVGNGRPTEKTNTAAFGLPAGENECLLYLPLYNGVSRLDLGIPASNKLESVHATAKPIVVYGTSIVQGGCASRPGMAHVAILGRMLDRPTINLGFSGSGRLEPAVSALLAELDPAVLVIDCLWNMDVSDQEVASRIRTLVELVRKARPDTPILFVGQSNIAPESHPTPVSKVQAETVKGLTRSGIRGLFLADGAGLLGTDGEGTVDGVHPNDLGMMRQAEALRPILSSILRR